VDLLILPVIWAAVLIPPWLRRRREGRPAESILTFHRKLWELERTSIYSDAAYSDAVYSDGYVDDADGVAFDEGGFDADGNPVERGLAGRVDPVGASVAARRVGGPGRGSASAPSSAQRLASRTALRRRRRIFSGLLGGLLTSLAAAALTGTAMAWSVHAAITLLFVTYIALLVRHHQRVVEQVTKVRYISPIRAPRPAVVVLRSGTATGH
jgi:hypothetical protein